MHLQTLRGCDRWPRPAAALGWEMRGCGCGFELGLCVPCRAGKVGSGSGQLWAAAPRSRRELRVEGASHGRSGAGQVWVARPRRWGGSFRWVWSQREGEKSEGRAALCRGGGQLPPVPTCWEGWGSVTTASTSTHGPRKVSILFHFRVWSDTPPPDRYFILEPTSLLFLPSLPPRPFAPAATPGSRTPFPSVTLSDPDGVAIGPCPVASIVPVLCIITSPKKEKKYKGHIFFSIL